MKLLTINKNNDIDTINQANIFDKLIDSGYMDENKNVLKEFEIHVHKKRQNKERICEDCGHVFSKGERGVPMMKKTDDKIVDIIYCKECYKK